MTAQVKELNRHTPTVESVIARLQRHQERIKHLSVVIQWDDDSLDVVGDPKPLSVCALHALVIQDDAREGLRE